MIWEVLVVAIVLVAAGVAVGLRFVRAARVLTAPAESSDTCSQECSSCTLAESAGQHPAATSPGVGLNGDADERPTLPDNGDFEMPKHSKSSLPILSLTILTLLSHGSYAHAADTMEPFDLGATDLDFYQGYDGIGLRHEDRGVYSDIMWGYGVVDGLSAYAGTTLEGDGRLANGAATPVDTDHLDLDLILDCSSSGGGFGELQIAPGVEINYDLVPDLGLWGLYSRILAPIHSREIATAEVADHEQAREVAVPVEVTLGTYYSISDAHQLLLEADALFRGDPAEDERGFEAGGIALGYNACVARDCSLELITQVYVDVPQGAESLAAGVMAGFIATMPAAGP